MKRPSLYRFLLTFACAIACVYTYFAIAAARSDSALFALIGCIGLMATLPLVKRIRSAYAKRVWLPTLMTVISATVSFDVGWRWPLTHTLSQLPSLLSGALWWIGVIAHAWISIGLLVAGVWFTAALLRWWRLEHVTGYDSFVELLDHGAGRVVPGYLRIGKAALIGAGPGLLAGLICGLIVTLLPPQARAIIYVGDVLRLLAGALFGFWSASRHVAEAASLKRLNTPKRARAKTSPLTLSRN